MSITRKLIATWMSRLLLAKMTGKFSCFPGLALMAGTLRVLASQPLQSRLGLVGKGRFAVGKKEVYKSKSLQIKDSIP